MNPVIRHFLPSVVRGVYRSDDAFSKMEDGRRASGVDGVSRPFASTRAKTDKVRIWTGQFSVSSKRLTLDRRKRSTWHMWKKAHQC
jgi:hypothetical protein